MSLFLSMYADTDAKQKSLLRVTRKQARCTPKASLLTDEAVNVATADSLCFGYQCKQQVQQELWSPQDKTTTCACAVEGLKAGVVTVTLASKGSHPTLALNSGPAPPAELKALPTDLCKACICTLGLLTRAALDCTL